MVFIFYFMTNTVQKLDFSIANDIGKKINGDIYFNNDFNKKLPIILVFHGFKGYKNWGFFPFICNQFANNSYISICFNFSLNGINSNDYFIDNIEDFANNTISQEFNDAILLINKIQDKTLLNPDIYNKWNGEIYLLGFSLGGGIAMLVANHFPNLIYKIALWAPVACFDRYTQRQKDLWKKNNYFEFFNSNTQQTLKMNYSYIEDLENNINKYNIINIIKNLECKICIIHGNEDITIPKHEIQLLIDNADKANTVFYHINNTGHSFGISHPMIDVSDKLNYIISLTKEFFSKKDLEI